jgi:hypothetical protein
MVKDLNTAQSTSLPSCRETERRNDEDCHRDIGDYQVGMDEMAGMGDKLMKPEDVRLLQEEYA